MADDQNVPIFDPTGKVRMIPKDQVDAAMSAGGKRAVKMSDPKGTQRWVREDQVDQAKQAGGKLVEDRPGAVSRFASSAAESSGLSTLAHAAAHPIDSLNTVLDAGAESMGFQPDKGENPILNGIKGAVDNSVDNAKRTWADYHREGLSRKTQEDAVRTIPVVGPVYDKAQKQYDSGDTAGMAGTLAGFGAALVAPKVVKETAPGVARVANRVAAEAPEAADSAAAGIVNRTVGSRKADFARGSNPGRGYIKAKIGPSATMESIADKAATAKGDIAAQLQDAYAGATKAGKKIPAADVQKAIDSVIDDAKNSAGGPGVLTDPETYEELRKTFAQSIADAHKQGGFTPQELWDIRKNIDRNLNWGDQAKLNMTKVQQRVSGSLGGLLKDTVPETVELNRQYGDLNNLANRAEQRALTHQSPLTSMAGKAALAGAGAILGHGSPEASLLGAAAGVAADSVPVKTALANWVSKSGRAAVPVTAAAGDALESGGPTAAAVPAALGAVPGDDQVDKPDRANDEQNTEESRQHVPNATPGPAPTIQEKEVVAPEAGRGVEGVTVPVVVPPKEEGPGPQSSLEPTPETHVFSPQQWLAANPGGDHEAAAEAAREEGYEVA